MNFNDTLRFAMFEVQGSSGYSLKRDRPYDGQVHTDNGIRGKTLIEGLTMRDIVDCIVLGLLDVGGIEKEHPVHDDIYSIDLQEIDPGAMIQNTMCHVEKMMGIFPNVPKLHYKSNKAEEEGE